MRKEGITTLVENLLSHNAENFHKGPFGVPESFWYPKTLHKGGYHDFCMKFFSSQNARRFRRKHLLVYMSTCPCLLYIALACFKTICQGKIERWTTGCELEKEKKNKVSTKVGLFFLRK